MLLMTTDQCTEACGYVAAIIAAFSYGSFGVPVKGKTAAKLDVDPLVMQTYKSIMCFLTCWLIIPMGKPFGFTAWGIVSGIFWVPGGTAGIYAIRNAGLAIAVGTWSSINVVSSFCWGTFVFHERVKSEFGASCAALVLCLGLGGMSRYSKPLPTTDGGKKSPLKDYRKKSLTGNIDGGGKDAELLGDDDRTTMRNENESSPSKDDARPAPGGASDLSSGSTQLTTAKRKRVVRSNSSAETRKMTGPVPQIMEVVDNRGDLNRRENAAPSSSSVTPMEIEPLVSSKSERVNVDSNASDTVKKNSVVIFNGRLVLTRRQLGMLCAAFNGCWGGTNLIPLHYASREGYGGPGYVISFACGSMIVTVSLWVFRYLFILHRLNGAYKEAYDALPPFHLRQMWLPGSLSGGMYSLGNFASIIAVTYLGQGVGYSFIQMSMLVSGLWGIFYFGEIQGETMITKWLTAALTTVFGIIWLSYEHVG